MSNTDVYVLDRYRSAPVYVSNTFRVRSALQGRDPRGRRTSPRDDIVTTRTRGLGVDKDETSRRVDLRGFVHEPCVKSFVVLLSYCSFSDQEISRNVAEYV